jgi:hypothetical protein
MWHHVAFAADNSNLGGSVSLWVDGVRVVNRKAFVPLTPMLSTFTLGSNSKLENLVGNIDQFKVRNDRTNESKNAPAESNNKRKGSHLSIPWVVSICPLPRLPAESDSS